MIPAPSFALQDQDDTTHSLADMASKWVVLYFYPKDDTPGCTKEACAFRDSIADLKAMGAEVVGISKDSVASHKKFAQKYELNFPLLGDPDHIVMEAYGAWALKKFIGKEYMGTVRKTVLISPEGMIAKEYPNVNPSQHAEAVIVDLKALQAA